MLVQFSVWPADQPHMHADVARVRDILKETGLEFEIGAMGTTIAGDWEAVMDAIRRCHEAVSGQHQRVLTSITIDDHPASDQSIRRAMEKVEQVSAE